MEENIIQCPECDSDNLESSFFCCQCGVSLRVGIPSRLRKRQWLSVLALSLLLSSVMTFVLVLILLPQEGKQMPPMQDGHMPETLAVGQPDTAIERPMLTGKPWSSSATTPFRPAAAERSVVKGLTREQQEEKMVDQMVVGSVSIIDPGGLLIAEVPAAVVSGVWLALPARACLGGDRWFFSFIAGRDIAIEGGLWIDGDAVGFWRLKGDARLKGPDFKRWNRNEPVQWMSLLSKEISDPISLTAAGEAGIFIFCSLPETINVPGVFLQENKVVGWTFGDYLDGAYMWGEEAGKELKYESHVEDFFNATFAGGREEQFARALAMGSESPAKGQLKAFAEGFRLEAKVSPEDLPMYLRPEIIFPYIQQLVRYMVQQGDFREVAGLSSEPLLWTIQDAGLLHDVVRATEKSYGLEAAVNFIEQTVGDQRHVFDDADPHLDGLHLDLYLRWIASLLEEEHFDRGRRIFKRAQKYFEDALELHLLGVELALADGNWQEAERLLYLKEYPPALREKKMILAAGISKLKGREGHIVITFSPGSRKIPVTARINEALEHEFLIDTGASFVTIPSSTLEALGLEGSVGTTRKVQTAGGVVTAREILLPSIELQGWAVDEVPALVIDLPDQPGLGLLGLSFLNRFRMDLKVDEGVLLLDPL